MPKLILKFDDRVLREYVIETSATIGRLRDNTVVLDNPAVSSHHARVYRDGDRFVIEDLKSKNGTYVNDKFVMNRRSLRNGDVVRIGKHQLVFDEAVLVDDAEAVFEELGDTVYLDTEDHKAVLAKLRAARWGRKLASGPPTEKVGATPAKPGILRVVAGRAERQEYALEANTSLIGASDEALVRLHGWFKPKVAVAIARNGEGYVATALGGATQVNKRPLSGRHILQNGDVLDVSGLTLEFRLPE
jgi:pSer/pThr/pTyr-binding forkhead associated (FHA) protein